MELNQLDEAQREDVSFSLARLWDDFLDKFGASDDITARATEKEKHISELRDSAEFMRRGKGYEERYGYYYLAPALLAQYLDLLCGLVVHNAELGAAVVSLIDEGRRARALGRSNLFREPAKHPEGHQSNPSA